MVIKVFISGISASKEVKKRQQRALLILDSCKVDYESIDITEPGMEDQREFMQQNSKPRGSIKTPSPPQFFNEANYCGDYEDFDSAVEVNQVLSFLKLENEVSNAEILLNDTSPKEEKVSTNGVNHAKEGEEEVTQTSREEKPAPKPTAEPEDEEEEEEEDEEEEEGEAWEVSVFASCE